MMKVLNAVAHTFFKAVPLLILLLLLPFLLTFDSVLYWLTRPSCLTCNTLVEFLKTSSISAVWVGSVAHSLGVKNVAFFENYKLKHDTHGK